MPKVSVIVPTFGDWGPLGECLDCLARQTIPADAFEILIASNNRENKVPEGFVLPENARVVWEPQPGSYAARNAALANARGEVIFFTDADCLPDEAWIETGLRTLDQDESLMRCAGRIDIFPADGAWNGAGLYDALFCLQQDEFARTGQAATANLAVRRDAFERAGTFDAKRFSGGDMEWNRRAEAAGLPLRYVPEMIVRHPARDSLAQHVRKARRIAGARYVSRANSRPWRRRVPRIEYIFPSLRALGVTMGATDHPLAVRLKAWGVHTVLRWVDLFETLRLGLLGKTPERR